MQAACRPAPSRSSDRVTSLIAAAKRAAIKKAREEAESAFDKLDDILDRGWLLRGARPALIDLPLFPFCCMKGPVVRITPR